MNSLSASCEKSIVSLILLVSILAGFSGAYALPDSTIHIKILAINDFHGRLPAGRLVDNRPAGGAAVLASYLKAAERGMEHNTIIVHAGDQVGASSPVSALLKDEPSIMFMNTLANKYCRYRYGSTPLSASRNPGLFGDPRCNMAATIGNHEFDKGVDEMMRLIFGGNHPDGPFLENPWRGALFPYVVSNVVDTKTGKHILPQYVIKKVDGVQIAFIGAVLKGTPGIVTPSAIEGLTFLDEAESINKCIPELRAKHVSAVIVLIHQGGYQASYRGATFPGENVAGPIGDIVSRLDNKVDVVISGHTHTFINALLKNKHGKNILVTQAFSYGTAYADIDLELDRATKNIVRKSASIVTTYADAGPGLTPDPAVSRLVTTAEARVGPLVHQVIGQAAADITGEQNSSGESALGNLIADAQRSAFAADFAFTNPGGIRSNIHAGAVTWSALYEIQPFNNYLVRMHLTGRQIYDLLNQQWQLGTDDSHPRMLQISGLAYTWDSTLPAGSRIVKILRNSMPIDPAAVYTVVVNSFLAGGGDGFKVLTNGTSLEAGTVDLNALIAYIRKLPQPFSARINGRITRLK
jgi:5'-nucleotidase